MPPIALNTLAVSTRRQWRHWLEKHYDREPGIWLIFNKRHTGAASLSYDDAVEEALCYGWIDSIIRRIDDGRYARKFTPRKADSRWSEANRRRYADLKSRGLLASPGLQRPPTSRGYDVPRASASAIPSYIKQSLRANPRSRKYFEQLAPSHRRAYIGWIDSAKREETKQKRLAEALRLLAAGQKLGLK
jgi:uncharacterized protein YdeI (YjbR/CyaY-like superfamily)